MKNFEKLWWYKSNTKKSTSSPNKPNFPETIPRLCEKILLKSIPTNLLCMSKILYILIIYMVNSKKKSYFSHFHVKNSHFAKVINGLEHVFITDDVKGFFRTDTGIMSLSSITRWQLSSSTIWCCEYETCILHPPEEASTHFPPLYYWSSFHVDVVVHGHVISMKKREKTRENNYEKKFLLPFDRV